MLTSQFSSILNNAIFDTYEVFEGILLTSAFLGALKISALLSVLQTLFYLFALNSHNANFGDVEVFENPFNLFVFLSHHANFGILGGFEKFLTLKLSRHNALFSDLGEFTSFKLFAFIPPCAILTF